MFYPANKEIILHGWLWRNGEKQKATIRKTKAVAERAALRMSIS